MYRVRNGWGNQRWVITIGAALLAMGPLAACADTQHRAASEKGSATSPAESCASGQADYARTELFFGKSIPGGGAITDAAFTQFLDQEVTPRFPAGFTVVPAIGQYRETNGTIDHEASDMVIFIYPQSSAGDAAKKINEIRAAYNKTFHQESVLREDDQSSCVSF